MTPITVRGWTLTWDRELAWTRELLAAYWKLLVLFAKLSVGLVFLAVKGIIYLILLGAFVYGVWILGRVIRNLAELPL